MGSYVSGDDVAGFDARFFLLSSAESGRAGGRVVVELASIGSREIASPADVAVGVAVRSRLRRRDFVIVGIAPVLDPSEESSFLGLDGGLGLLGFVDDELRRFLFDPLTRRLP